MNTSSWSFVIFGPDYRGDAAQGQLLKPADLQASAAANPQLEALS